MMLFGSIVNFGFKIELLEAADKDSTNLPKPKKGIKALKEIKSLRFIIKFI